MTRQRLLASYCASLTWAMMTCGVTEPWRAERSTAQAEEAAPPFEIVPPDKWTGEPYELAGKRLVFTSWYYVRQGGFSWVDDQGHGVAASAQAKIGPWDAHFRRADDAPRGVRLTVERPQRVGPLIASERPWEEMGLSLRTVLQEGDKYRAWGHCQNKDGKRYECYFESADGQTWTRPNLGLVDYGGNKENNLFAGALECVFLDPTAPPAERYKGIRLDHISVDELKVFVQKHPDCWEHRAMRGDAKIIYAVFGLVSSDGLRWTRLAEPFTVEHSDTQIVAGYDAARKKYMIFTRNYFIGPRSPGASSDPLHVNWIESSRRSIGYTESDRFADFPLSEVIVTPRPDMTASQLLYTNCYTTIPGAPDQQLLFPTVWDVGDDATHLEMAVGYRGRVWNWLGGKLMETGRFGEFDGGSIFWHPNLTELANGDFALSYTGYAFPHKYPRGAWSYRPGYAVWPKGRLVSIEAVERGEFTTVSIVPPGRKLLINAVTKRAGEIRVQVDGVAGRSLDDCDPIIGDQYRKEVTWKGNANLGSKEGEPIRLRFRMEKAQLFGLEFE